jgi:hypothetical protein
VLSAVTAPSLSPRCRARWALAVPLLLLATGCQPGAESLVAVRGRVSYRGIPLHTGTVVFAPDAQRGTNAEMARADVQPDGTYVLNTGDQSGAAPGWYRVTVLAMEPAAGFARGGSFLVPRSLIPEKYRDPDLSGLACEVKAGQDNVIDFNLE